MKDVADSTEITKLENRVKRLYGMGRISLLQHGVGLNLLKQLKKSMTDEQYAARLAEMLKANNNAQSN